MKTSKIFVRSRSWMAVTLIGLTVSACGGGGGGTAGVVQNLLSGVAVDGYLQNATAFLDLNGNGVLDTGEPSAVTDATGRYLIDYSGLSSTPVGVAVVVTGGVDTDTGYAFTGKLVARVENPSQGQVVTPLTTLVDSMVSQGLATDIDEAKQSVATSLGLTVAELSTDPVAAIASNPAIYTTSVAVQRSVQLLATANAQTGETAHESQERMVRALASAIRSQSSIVSVDQLVASLSLQNTTQAQELARSISLSVSSSLTSSGHEAAKTALKTLDEIRIRSESSDQHDLQQAAQELDTERGKTSSTPYSNLLSHADNDDAVRSAIASIGGTTSTTTLTQPASTTGRLLASNCFQCHGTGGVGGFENIKGEESSDILEYMTRSANSSIMAAHAQGYTRAQLNSIISYLQQ